MGNGKRKINNGGKVSKSAAESRRNLPVKTSPLPRGHADLFQEVLMQKTVISRCTAQWNHPSHRYSQSKTVEKELNVKNTVGDGSRVLQTLAVLKVLHYSGKSCLSL